jgi:hypothetical protein
MARPHRVKNPPPGYMRVSPYLLYEPAGDRRFTATDPEGQVWVFIIHADAAFGHERASIPTL